MSGSSAQPHATMESINKLILQGWVEDAPEVRYFSYELARCSLKLRTEEEINSSERTRTLTLWHSVIAWGEVAKYLAQHVHSGDVLRVYGHIRYHRETDRDGISRVVTEIEAAKVELIARRAERAPETSIQAAPEEHELPWERYAPIEGEDPMA